MLLNNKKKKNILFYDNAWLTNRAKSLALAHCNS